MFILLLTTKHLRVVFANTGKPAAAVGSPSVTSSFSLKTPLDLWKPSEACTLIRCLFEDKGVP